MPGIDWIQVASLDDLPPGSSREFIHEGRVYALFRIGEAITCLDGLCPHNGGRLVNGPVDGFRVTCPRLGCLRWSFDLRTGACSVGQALTRRLYPVRVEADAIFVALPGR